MKLILAADGQVEYDLEDEMLDLELESLFDDLFECQRTVTDGELARVLMDSAWEQGVRNA